MPTPETCIHGHPLTPENVYTYVDRGTERRQCRTCHRIAAAQYARRQREQDPERCPRGHDLTRTGVDVSGRVLCVECAQRCRHGHLWAEYGYTNSQGKRVCRMCQRERMQRARRA